MSQTNHKIIEMAGECDPSIFDCSKIPTPINRGVIVHHPVFPEYGYAVQMVPDAAARLEALRRARSLVFMRLNAARDRRDKKPIEILTEISETLR